MFNESDRLLLREIHRRLIDMNATVASLPSEIAALQAAVANEVTVEQSAITLINGIPAMIANAVAAAQAAGATPDQLAALATLQTQISSSATALAAAVTGAPAAAPTSSSTTHSGS
jgi:hypothetical protein